MTQDKASELTETNLEQLKAPKADAPAAAEAPASAAVARFRREVFADSDFEVLRALGEEPKGYQRLMESLLDDLQPQPGLESVLVEQIGETAWSMRRAQHMRNGLALKRIQKQTEAERTAAMERAQAAYAVLEPFERLQDALARRGPDLPAGEIDEFVENCEDDDSQEMQDFVGLLESLKAPMEEPERKAALREARAELRRLMEPYESGASICSRRVEQVDSAENLAALMAPRDKTEAHLQRLEDSHLRKLCQLTQTLAKIRQGALEIRREGKKDDQTRNLYENKQNSDKLTGRNSDI